MSGRRLAAGVAAFLLLLAGGVAGAQTVERIDLSEFGLYRATYTGNTATPGTAAGNTRTITNVEFYEQTTRVPARIGTAFGIRAVVVGSPQGAQVTLQARWLFPPAGLRNPQNGAVYFEESSPTVRTIGVPGVRGYSFDHPWELVTGDWTLELWSGNRKMLSKTFTIYTP